MSAQEKEEENSVSYMSIFKIMEIGRYFLDMSNIQSIIAQFKLRPTEFHAMMRIFMLSLDKPEGISLKMLTQYLKASQPAVSMRVASLIEKGYITRKSDPSDKRKILLSISEKHIAYFMEMMNKQEAVLNERLQHISIEKREELIRFSESMYDYLHASCFTE